MLSAEPKTLIVKDITKTESNNMIVLLYIAMEKTTTNTRSQGTSE